MPSRRRFLQMNILGAAMVLTGRDTIATADPPKSEVSPPQDVDERDYRNDWPRYVTAQMNEVRAR